MSTRRKASHICTSRPSSESLERRQLFAVVPLTGSGNGDDFTVSYDSASGQYSFDGGTNTPAPVDAAGFTGVTLDDTAEAVDTLTVLSSDPAQPPTLLNDAGAVGTALYVSVAPGQTLILDSTEHLSDLSIGQGATVQFRSGSYGTLVTDSLEITGTANAWTGSLDLTRHDLVVQYGDLPTVTNQIAFGRNSTHGGNGITSSAAAADPAHVTALGVVANDAAGTPLYTAFDGQDVSSTAVLTKYTYYGDANLDATVNGADYVRIDAGIASRLNVWVNGDFNYSGSVDGSDYTLIDNAFNSGSTVALAPAFTVTTPSSAQIDLSWQPVTGVQTYELFRSTDPNFTPGYDTLYDDNTGTNAFVDNQVVAGMTYYYKAFGSNSDTTSTVAAIGSATAASDTSGGDIGPNVGPNTDPTTLIATGINDLEIFLSWTSNSNGKETGFQIQSEPHTVTPDQNAWQTVGTVTSGVTTFTARGTLASTPTNFFSENTDYDFRIHAMIGTGPSGFSNTATAQVVVPSRPQTLIIIGGHTQTAARLEQSWFAPAGQGFSVGIEWKDLIKLGYNAFMSPEAGWAGSVVTPSGQGPLYGELNEEIRRGHAQDIGLIGYSHGGGTIFNMSQHIHADRTRAQFQEVIFTGTIDAVARNNIDNSPPTPLTKSPGAVWPGSDNINYWEPNGEPLGVGVYATHCRGQSLPGAANTEISTVFGVPARHDTIYASPVVITGIEQELIGAFQRSGSFALPASSVGSAFN